MPKKPKQTPRYLPSSLPSGAELYKAGVYAENQKFGRSKEEARQLVLSEPPAEPADIEITGLSLTVAEDKALSALQILLHRTGYQGNLQATEVESAIYQGRFTLPRLQFTPSEYLEAYGLKQHKGKYRGWQREEALQALQLLAEKQRTIVYKRARYHGKGQARKKLYDVIRHKGTILQIVEGYKDLEEEEATRIEAGEVLPGRVRKLAIQFGPLIMDNIETFFLLKPAKLHQEIEDLLGPKRISRSVSLFIEWLLIWNRTPVKIRRDELARRLRLHNLIEQRKPSELKRQLLECCETAKALGFLLEYREDAFGVLTFQLNPERCKRLGQEAEEAEAAK